MWKQALLLHALLLAAATDGRLTIQPNCQESCGGVVVPYPFGIGTGCFRKGFEIACVKSTPALAATRPAIHVLSLSVMPRPEVRVMLPVARQCYDSSGNITSTFNGTVDLNRAASVYRISNTKNELFILGCSTFAYTNSRLRNISDGDSFAYNSGCVAYCEGSDSAQDGECAGIGCCHVDIPPGLTDNQMYFTNDEDWSHDGQEDYSPCDYAFIVEKGNYTFRKADLTSMPVGKTMPLRLDWAIRDRRGSSSSASCAQAPGMPGYTCVSDHSECVDSTNGPGYACNCSGGYEGNPYLVHGCTNINECERPGEYSCNGKCSDNEGSYTCDCHPGYDSKDAKLYPCNPKFSLAAKLAIGICLGVSLLVVSLLVALIMLQKRKLDKHFEKNGGKLLQNVKGLNIFSKEGLKKITKNYSEFLGTGNFGKVYKGTLPDDTIVAVKASIKVDEDTKQEFAKEVEIHTHMIHKNILKLVGCCLEVDVPMLVYEFAANGSLQETLHNKKTKKLPLDLRLDIAIGSAEGLRYMHSSTTQAIRHGDVKPDNILLDDKLTPKISDFGLSKLLKEESFAKTVVGCMGYIDPVFMKTGLLTQKSDVYSFGAVLLELITRKKNVYDENHSLIIDFCKVYEKEKSGRSMFDHEIAIEEHIFILEEIGRLAIECLNEDIEERPDMTEVAQRLMMFRRDMNIGKAHNIDHHHLEDITLHGSPNNSDISVTTNATSSVTSTPINNEFANS